LLISVAGWMNQPRRLAIDYLREENRVLKEQLGGRRLRLNNDQRRRLASKAKRLGRRLLAQVATIVTLQTLMGLASETGGPEVRRDRSSGQYPGTTKMPDSNRSTMD
jgi:hypothetical protein